MAVKGMAVKGKNDFVVDLKGKDDFVVDGNER